MKGTKTFKKLDLTINNAFDFHAKLKGGMDEGKVKSLKIKELINIDVTGIQILISFINSGKENTLEISNIKPELKSLIEKTGFSHLIK